MSAVSATEVFAEHTELLRKRAFPDITDFPSPPREAEPTHRTVGGERDLPAPFAGVSHSHEVTRGRSKIRVSAGLCLP